MRVDYEEFSSGMLRSRRARLTSLEERPARGFPLEDLAIIGGVGLIGLLDICFAFFFAMQGRLLCRAPSSNAVFFPLLVGMQVAKAGVAGGRLQVLGETGRCLWLGGGGIA